MNALNALFGLGLADTRLVSLACQAEFGTGVRAGSLDQATEQMGSATRGAVVSSNPRDGFRVLGRFAVPSERIRILFPYSMDRDREAWRWSAGTFGADGGAPALTTGEFRKLTGKSAEIAAMILAIPIDEAMRVSEQLRTVGRVIRGRIGVTIAPVTKEVAEAIGLGVPRGACRRHPLDELDAGGVGERERGGERPHPAGR